MKSTCEPAVTSLMLLGSGKKFPVDRQALGKRGLQRGWRDMVDISGSCRNPSAQINLVVSVSSYWRAPAKTNFCGEGSKIPRVVCVPTTGKQPEMWTVSSSINRAEGVNVCPRLPRLQKKQTHSTPLPLSAWRKMLALIGGFVPGGRPGQKKTFGICRLATAAAETQRCQSAETG